MKYEIALQIVRSAEHALMGSRPSLPYRWLQQVMDTVLDGPSLIIAGGHILINRMLWIGVTTAIFMVFLGAVEKQPASSLLLPSLFLAVGVVYFSTPSRSMTAGVTAPRVEQVREFILSTIHDRQELELLAQSIDVVRTHTMQKLARFNVLAGIAWGVLFWFVGAHALAPGLSSEAMSRGLSYSMLGMLVFALVLAAGLCHATAVRAVCQILDFAMIEARAEPNAGDAAQ
ncbi:hypothetical protein [Pseudoxanthomonas mexicana]